MATIDFKAMQRSIVKGEWQEAIRKYQRAREAYGYAVPADAFSLDEPSDYSNHSPELVIWSGDRALELIARRLDTGLPAVGATMVGGHYLYHFYYHFARAYDAGDLPVFPPLPEKPPPDPEVEVLYRLPGVGGAPSLGITVSTKRLGGRAVGSRGSGKTIYAAWQTFLDFQAGMGGIVIDPMGTFSNYVLARIEAAGDEAAWERIAYVPVGGMVVLEEGDDRDEDELTEEEAEQRTYVVPTPFLYDRTGHDALADQTGRFVRLASLLNPQSENAPVQGMPAIKRTTTYAGMLLAAMGCQLVPDAAYLIDTMSEDKKASSRWAKAMRQAEATNPRTLQRPAHYFRDIFPPLRLADQQGQVATFMAMIDPYVVNPRLMAQYGANAWGVDLRAVEAGQLVIFDCQYLPEEEQRTGLTWLFTRCMEYFRKRGPRRDITNFIVDELSYLVPGQNALLEADLDKLIMQMGRNYGIATFFTYQDVLQPSANLQTVLHQLGYSLFGPATNKQAALELAQQLSVLDPWDTKSTRDIERRGPKDFAGRFEVTVDQVTTYLSLPEQLDLAANRHRNRPGFEFALSMAGEEGRAATYQGDVHVREMLASQPFDYTGVERKKRELVKRIGRSVADVLAEIDARQPKDQAGNPTPSIREFRQSPLLDGPPPGMSLD